MTSCVNVRNKVCSSTPWGCSITYFLVVMQFLKSGVTVLPHSQTVLSLSIPCDFFLFPTLKKFLSGRCYESRQAVGSAIRQCLAIKLQSQEYFLNNPYYFRSELVFQTARKTSREVMLIALFEINTKHITYRTALV